MSEAYATILLLPLLLSPAKARMIVVTDLFPALVYVIGFDRAFMCVLHLYVLMR